MVESEEMKLIFKIFFLCVFLFLVVTLAISLIYNYLISGDTFKRCWNSLHWLNVTRTSNYEVYLANYDKEAPKICPPAFSWVDKGKCIIVITDYSVYSRGLRIEKCNCRLFSYYHCDLSTLGGKLRDYYCNLVGWWFENEKI